MYFGAKFQARPLRSEVLPTGVLAMSASTPPGLVKSIPSYIKRSIVTIVRIFVIYRPFRFFVSIGGVLFSIGFVIGLRFLAYYIQGDGGGHVQSLILATMLMGMGFQTILIAFLADLLAANRKLVEEIRSTQKIMLLNEQRGLTDE